MRRRRPQQDYYYDDYEEYENDYPEERLNRRRKPNRQRNRRPEYDDVDDYGGPRNYKPDDSYEDVRPAQRERNRNKDDLDDYEYERSSYERPRSGNRPSEGRRYKEEDRRSGSNDRRLSKDRRPSEDGHRSNKDEKDSHFNGRRSNFDAQQGGERRPHIENRRPVADKSRREHGERKRPHSERRPQYEDEEEDFDPPLPRKQIADAVEDDEEAYHPARFQPPEPKIGVVPKVRSASPVASIFSRPRAPPRINRPVPTNEKKKYEYASTNAPSAAAASPIHADEDQYDEEYDYEAEAPKLSPSKSPQKVETLAPSTSTPPRSKNEHRKPVEIDIESKSHSFESEELEDEVVNIGSRKKKNKSEEKVVRNPPKVPLETSRPNINTRAETRPAQTFEDEDEEFTDYTDVGTDKKKETPAEVHSPPRAGHKPVARPVLPSPQLKPLSLETEPIKPARPQQYRFPTPSATPPQIKSNYQVQQQEQSQDEPEREIYSLLDKELPSTLPEPSGFKPVGGYTRELHSETDNFRPSSVRVVKRPFLPSRGGSPYLPRGLKPVGVGITNADYSLANRLPSNIDQSHITGVLVQNSHPHERVNYNSNPQPVNIRPTQRPQETLRSSLDDIYNSDYDVTINDALNPTLKPISQSHESPVAFALSKYDRTNPYARSDTSHASSVFRSTAIQAPFYVQSRNRRPAQQTTQAIRSSQQYYDEYEY